MPSSEHAVFKPRLIPLSISHRLLVLHVEGHLDVVWKCSSTVLTWLIRQLHGRDHICRYLSTSNICALARASLRVYRNIQTSLYHHPRIDTFESLTLLVRTLNEMKLRRRGDSRLSISKEMARLDITVDPVKDAARNGRGQGPAAVLLSRMITIVSR